MEAPEKIYIGEVQATPYGDLAFIDTWLDVPFDGLVESYEYTRTDVFIEKACDAYCKVCGHYAHKTPTHICRQDCDYYKAFKQAIEE